jgi:RNA recognition motif-containing protein
MKKRFELNKSRVFQCDRPERTIMKIFIGNLSYNVTEDDLRQAFEPFGQVTSTSIVKDPDSHRSKGFGFVEMPDAAEARSAIMSLNGQALKGRTITTNEARPDSDARRAGDRGDRGDRRGGGRY